MTEKFEWVVQEGPYVTFSTVKTEFMDEIWGIEFCMDPTLEPDEWYLIPQYLKRKD